MAQRVAVLTKLILEARTGRARLDARGAGGRVDVQQAREAAEVDRDRAAELLPYPGLHAAHDARPPAVRDRCDALGRTPIEDPLDLVLVAGVRDEVRRIVDLPAKAADDVAVGLAQRMRYPLVAIAGEDLTEGTRRLDPRRRQIDRFERHRLLHLAAK